MNDTLTLGSAPRVNPSRSHDAALAAIRGWLGDRLSTGASVRQLHGTDATGHIAAAPDAVAFVTSTAEVSLLLATCSEWRMPVIPYGSGTSLEGQIAAVHGGLCIDLSRMSQVLEINVTDLDCRVQAGVTRQQLNDHLKSHGLFFPVDPGADATLGGMSATRASGTNAVRYGTMAQNVLGLTVVLANGEVINTGTRARKSAAGYDLTRLFVGSEGTLGVITEIQLRLHAYPSAVAAAVSSFVSLAGAIDTVVQTLHSGVPIARVELLDEVLMEAVNRYSHLEYPVHPTLFFEFHGTEASVAEQTRTVAELARDNGGSEFRWATLPEERSRLWKARHQAFWAARNLRPACTPIATDVCVPISSLTECIVETQAEIEALGFPSPITGHVGDGNFHVLLLVDTTSPEEVTAAHRFNEQLVARAQRMGGTCSGEHGVGASKIDFLAREAGAAIETMRAVKRTLDPLGILNPGKLFRQS